MQKTKILALATANSPRICRLLDYYLDFQGTAFMISNSLLITNNHIVHNHYYAKGYYAEFNYEIDGNNQPKDTTRFELNPDKFYLANPEDELDFAIIAIGNRVHGNSKLKDIGYCKISQKETKIGEAINIIHHPLGQYKKIELNGKLIGSTEKYLYYDITTRSGSSGCPIFNSDFEVIGLHHYAKPREPKNSLFEHAHEGVSIKAILAYLKNQHVIQKNTDFVNL